VIPRALFAGAAFVALTFPACSPPPVDPLQLDGNRLIVSNQTPEPWANVEIWLNTYYRVSVPLIAAGERFQVGLDSFVAGFGQRFDYRRRQITSLQLTAKRADGTPFELKKKFEVSGLAGALAGLGGKH
jgi:hypothetical protein